MISRYSLLVFLLAATTLRAAIVADALLSFPAQTGYLEYDNLAALRNLPNYNTLRQNFAGKPLEEAKTVLGQLGIQEDEVDEVVTGSSANAYYGLVSGTFSGEAAAKRSKRFGVKLLATQAFCSGRETCIVFLENSLAAFGSMGRLREMLEARQGILARLSSNRDVASLLNNSDPRAPVRGMLCGNELKSSLSQTLQDWTGWKRDWSAMSSNISAVGYSIKLDSKAHVSATLECTSKTAAAVLVQVLSAAGTVASGENAPFQNLKVSNSANDVYFKADATVLTPTPAQKAPL